MVAAGRDWAPAAEWVQSKTPDLRGDPGSREMEPPFRRPRWPALQCCFSKLLQDSLACCASCWCVLVPPASCTGEAGPGVPGAAPGKGHPLILALVLAGGDRSPSSTAGNEHPAARVAAERGYPPPVQPPSSPPSFTALSHQGRDLISMQKLQHFSSKFVKQYLKKKKTKQEILHSHACTLWVTQKGLGQRKLAVPAKAGERGTAAGRVLQRVAS